MLSGSNYCRYQGNVPTGTSGSMGLAAHFVETDKSDMKLDFPNGAKAVEHDFYIYDCLIRQKMFNKQTLMLRNGYIVESKWLHFIQMAIK